MRVEIYTQLREGLNETKDQPGKASGVNLVEGIARAEAWGRKESGGPEEHKKEWREFWEAQALAEPREEHGLWSGELCSALVCARPSEPGPGA